MKSTFKITHILTILTFFGFLLSTQFFSPTAAFSDNTLLRKIISDYNIKSLDKSLADGSYRGEEGVLRIRPEIGKSLGMVVFVDQDYEDAQRLFKIAEESFEKTKEILISNNKERATEECARMIADHYLQYKKMTEDAEQKLGAYRSRLNPEVDERLDIITSSNVMEALLKKSFQKMNYGLRDALGYFYNVCQGTEKDNDPLTTENVAFVNHVYNTFVELAPENILNTFDLDRHNNGKHNGRAYNWKRALGQDASPFLPSLDAAFENHGDKIYDMDPLIFVALIRQESNFDPDAVSYVGAVGLTQIMPKTAKSLGMKNIHMPDYLEDAESILRREQSIKREAMATLSRINEENKTYYAKQALLLMRSSFVLGKKRKKLFERYRKELLENRADSRLKPTKAIEYGLKYFARLMKNQQGDISLALASYNAGPSRIRAYNGIPPFEETITFRNRVMEYYRDYLEKARKTLKTSQNTY
jgi:hypothetical protein